MSELLNNFYEVISEEQDPVHENSFTSTLRLNPSHPIYKGHFEQAPIAPGVCLIQIIKELVAGRLGRNIVLKRGDNIKFLAFINPRDTPEILLNCQIRTTEAGPEVNATFHHGRVTYVKFKGGFSFAE